MTSWRVPTSAEWREAFRQKEKAAREEYERYLAWLAELHSGPVIEGKANRSPALMKESE